MSTVLAFPGPAGPPPPPRGATAAQAAAWRRLLEAVAAAGRLGTIPRRALLRHAQERAELERRHAEARQATDLARRLAALQERTQAPEDAAVLSALADDLFARNLARAAAISALQLRLVRRLARWGLTPLRRGARGAPAPA